MTDATNTDDDRRELKRELNDVHLPELAEDGYIEWDEETQTIRRGPKFDDIEPLVQRMRKYESERYE